MIKGLVAASDRNAAINPLIVCWLAIAAPNSPAPGSWGREDVRVLGC